MDYLLFSYTAARYIISVSFIINVTEDMENTINLTWPGPAISHSSRRRPEMNTLAMLNSGIPFDQSINQINHMLQASYAASIGSFLSFSTEILKE